MKTNILTKTTILALALACAALTSCTTARTLLSQVSDVPLPDRVARQLYGTCRECQQYGPQPNCVQCRMVQNERREAAGMPNKEFNRRAASGNLGATRPVYVGTTRPVLASQPVLNSQRPTAPRTYPAQLINTGEASPIAADNGRKYTKQGNAYPARWYMPGELQDLSPEERHEILMEQLSMVNHDSELAKAYYDYATTVPKEEQATRPSRTTTMAGSSGYNALGY